MYSPLSKFVNAGVSVSTFDVVSFSVVNVTVASVAPFSTIAVAVAILTLSFLISKVNVSSFSASDSRVFVI